MTKEELQAISDLLDGKLEPINNKLDNLEKAQKKIEIAIENEIRPNIKLIAEGHGDLVSMQKQTLRKIDHLADKIDVISNRVVVLETKE